MKIANKITYKNCIINKITQQIGNPNLKLKNAIKLKIILNQVWIQVNNNKTEKNHLQN